MSDLTIVPAKPGEFAELARLIEVQNRVPETQCLHSGEHADEVEAVLKQPEAPIFMIARNGDVLAGAFGCEVDGEARGYLQGPFIAADDYTTVASELWQALYAATPSVARYDAFVNVRNENAAAFLAAAGFRRSQGAQVYVLPAASLPALNAPSAELFTDRCQAGVRALHDLAFPDSPGTIEPFMNGQNGNRRLFVFSDGDRCLGYVAASVNDNPREGYIDLLAVDASIRNQGYGRRLLLTAAHWLIEEKSMPQVGLTVLDMRSDTRELYARTGFQLLYSGVGYFRQARNSRVESHS